MTPGAKLILTPGPFLKPTVYRYTRQCYISNIDALGLVVCDKKIFKVVSIYLYVKHVTPAARPILTQCPDLNKLCISPLDNAAYQIS